MWWHLGMSSQLRAAASTCAAISRPAGLKLSFARAADWQHRGDCPPLPGSQSAVPGGPRCSPVHAGRAGRAIPEVRTRCHSQLRLPAVAGARDELPGEERGSVQRSTWLPALCILSPLIMSLFHLRCEKSWRASACSRRHLLGERVGSGADPARAGGRVLGYA